MLIPVIPDPVTQRTRALAGYQYCRLQRLMERMALGMVVILTLLVMKLISKVIARTNNL